MVSSYRSPWIRFAACPGAWRGFADGRATGRGTRPCRRTVPGDCWRSSLPAARLRSSISLPVIDGKTNSEKKIIQTKEKSPKLQVFVLE